MKLKLFLPFLLLWAFFNSAPTYAYPNFIGYGYTSCTVCHYNPYGNGALTDYGRALGASTISDDTLWFEGRDLNEIGEKSGFLYSKPFTKRIRPSLDYRGMYLQSDVGDDNSQDTWINMDANMSMVVRLGPEDNLDKFFITGTIGYAPLPRNGTYPDSDKYRSREYYAAYKINKNWGIYAGLMDKIYGIRIVNHEAFSRSQTTNTMNDQTHGIVIHYTSPKMDAAIQPFVGNLGEESIVRQKGISSNFEYTVNRRFRPGASVQVSESEYLKSYAYALHARAGFGEGNSVMLEAGQIQEEKPKRSVETTSRYWMIQTHSLMTKGFFFLNTIEYFKEDVDEESKSLKWGPGIQYFVFQGIELRFDIFNARSFSETANTDDRWDFTGQVHLWF